MSYRPNADEQPERPPSGVPLWRQVFDQAEHLAATRVENLMRTELFAALLSQTTMGSIEARRRAEALMRRWLHLWNLPANTDLRHLHDLVVSVDRRVRDVSRRLDELERLLAGPPHLVDDATDRRPPRRSTA